MSGTTASAVRRRQSRMQTHYELASGFMQLVSPAAWWDIWTDVGESQFVEVVTIADLVRRHGQGQTLYAGYSVHSTNPFPELCALDRACERAERKRKSPRRKQQTTAQRLLQKAVYDGRLRRPETCADCGKTCTPDGHHPDYDQPLEVEWLCRACHGFRHRKKAA